MIEYEKFIPDGLIIKHRIIITNNNNRFSHKVKKHNLKLNDENCLFVKFNLSTKEFITISNLHKCKTNFLPDDYLEKKFTTLNKLKTYHYKKLKQSIQNNSINEYYYSLNNECNEWFPIEILKQNYINTLQK